MATHYVDLDNPGAWNGRDGSDTSGNEYLGVSGLQYAADVVNTAGDVIEIKGTGNVDTLYSLSCDNQSGNFTRGEGVTWDGGSSTGVVSEIDGSNLPTVIEVTAGALANNDNLTGVTSGATADVAGAPSLKTNGVDVDTNAGTDVNYITFRGVASDWSRDGTRCKLDAQGSATGGDVVNISVSYICFENIEVDDADTRGLYATTVAVYINCYAHHCDSDGLRANGTGSSMIMCEADNNGAYGMYVGDVGFVAFCFSYSNGGIGIGSDDMSFIFGCVSHGNTTRGFDGDRIMTYVNCVADGNTQDGFYIEQETSKLIGCRATGNGDVGFEMVNQGPLVGWCYAPAASEDRDNTTAPEQNTTGAIKIYDGSSDTNNMAGTDTDGGYTDPTNDDFNLTSSASIRRTEIDLGVGS